MSSVNLSKEKLEILSTEEKIRSLIKELESRASILKQGIKQIDYGESMLEGRGILAEEVQKIMREGLKFI